MFLALRDIRFARGRFLLMAGVVALITVLLVLLSGLTAGLGNQSVSAIRALGVTADAVAFGAPAGGSPKASFTDSQVTADQALRWRQADGVGHAEPFGVSQTRMTAEGTANVAVFGAGGRLAPAPVADGSVVLSRTAAEDAGAGIGERIELGGIPFTVSAVVDDQWYSHTPVVWISLESWQAVAHLSDAAGGPVATAIAVELADGDADGTAARLANADAHTTTTSVSGAFQALGSYKSENGSLVLMQAFLYGISALVIVAFLSVWTIQRTRDIAVLKALGGSDGYLLRDALAQATIVLASGAAAGGAVGILGGLAAGQAAPFLLTPATTLLPVAGVVLLGLAGALLAVRRVARVDPLTALGGS
ncbi:ABC transporter permease [Arthrobacter ginkgonis]|uniref:ABC transporter permease n=1 Tax=Arthrobacter ginkgonis TaxID=1630594 RepID=A0ABP7D5N0_9MICC